MVRASSSAHCSTTMQITLSNLDQCSHIGLQPRAAKPPSFSSILLDAIYHSVDIDSNNDQHAQRAYYTPTPTSTPTSLSDVHTQHHYNSYKVNKKPETLDLRRAIMMEKLNEKQAAQNKDQHNAQPAGRELLSAPDESNSTGSQSSILLSSIPPSSPSRSSSGSGDSSSSTIETTDFSSSCFAPRVRPLRVRTSLDQRKHHVDHLATPPTMSKSGSTTKPKPIVSEIYGELKRTKQPLSPGARIVDFLNSIFHAKKKHNAAAVPDHQRRSNGTGYQSSACSSAPSFSRSCLSRKASSYGAGKCSTNGVKRSVRFAPGIVIEDGGEHECYRKPIPKANAAKLGASDRNSCGDPADSDPCTNGRKWMVEEEEIDSAIQGRTTTMRSAWLRKTVAVEDDGEGGSGGEIEDDARSCASSDLFELENLSAVGIGRYNEELPVYGTTILPVR